MPRVETSWLLQGPEHSSPRSHLPSVQRFQQITTGMEAGKLNLYNLFYAFGPRTLSKCERG
jgi:hypothetical protein